MTKAKRALTRRISRTRGGSDASPTGGTELERKRENGRNKRRRRGKGEEGKDLWPGTVRNVNLRGKRERGGREDRGKLFPVEAHLRSGGHLQAVYTTPRFLLRQKTWGRL